jgi:hypothetical protein
MAKLEQYRQYVRQILEEYSHYRPAYGDVTMELIIDTERDHYQLMSIGWHQQRRIYGLLIHIDIKNEHIWIQHDGTEGGIANELVALGVPKEDIVLAFHAPYKRPYTGFGTGIERLQTNTLKS